MNERFFQLGTALRALAVVAWIGLGAPSVLAQVAGAKPQVVVLATGGTIAGAGAAATNSASYQAAKVPVDKLIAGVPELADVAQVRGEQVFQIASESFTNEKLVQLGKRVSQLVRDPAVNGIVITHGTDTLEETAYCLDLLLDSPKPVVFVGAMRNSSELSWDGPANLLSAVRVAACTDARDLGVLVVMNEELIAAFEVTKTHTEKTDTFQSRDFGPLGLVDKDRVIVMRKPARRAHLVTEQIEERVDILKMYSGADGRFINFAIDEGAQGLVIEGLGRGNVTVAALDAIKRAVGQGVPVVITSRCPRGRVLDTYAYEGGGRQLTRLGAILGGLLPSHKARIKLMLALGAGYELRRIREIFEA